NWFDSFEQLPILIRASLLGISILLIISVGLAGLLIYQEETAKFVKNQDPYPALFPNLTEQTNNINKIEITQNENMITLLRLDSDWVIKQKHNYPVNLAKIKQMLVNLTSSKLQRQKTANTENYEKLGLDKVNATNIKLFGNENKIVDLFIGDFNIQLDGTYIRKNNNAQTWLTSGDLYVETDSSKWLRNEILSVSPDNIKKLVITQPGNQQLIIYKHNQTQTEYNIDSIPVTKILTDKTELGNIISVIENFNLQNIMPASSVIFSAESTVISKFYTFDNKEITINLATIDKKYYAKLSVSDFSNEISTDTASDNNIKADADIIVDNESGNDADIKAINVPVSFDVDELNKQLADWAFIISDSDYMLLTKKMADLVEDRK
ncbi:MAG: DUF4340 domain-containing protein, partial [Pseudomonadota bacterium]